MMVWCPDLLKLYFGLSFVATRILGKCLKKSIVLVEVYMRLHFLAVIVLLRPSAHVGHMLRIEVEMFVYDFREYVDEDVLDIVRMNDLYFHSEYNKRSWLCIRDFA